LTILIEQFGENRLQTKVLVLGSTGMLGHQIVNYFHTLKEYDVHDVSYRNQLRSKTKIIDVHQFNKLEKLVDKIQPSIIINCIGILIEGSEKSYAKATYINSNFPHLLSKLCYQINAKLIHISTDCVFSGNQGSYTERDIPDSDTIYGKTKFAGEIIDKNNVTLRTSIIGPELKSNGQGLLDWFLKEKNNEIDGYINAIWTGVTTLELSKIIKIIIDKKITGLYHISNNNKISKYKLLKIFNNNINQRFIINKNETIMNDKSLIDTRNELGYVIPSYNDMIASMFTNIFENADKYKHYDIF
tara:strand:- start:1024 stop:1926 length:903 start_codon:yes stop_codon:yes gene_type:complete